MLKSYLWKHCLKKNHSMFCLSLHCNTINKKSSKSFKGEFGNKRVHEFNVHVQCKNQEPRWKVGEQPGESTWMGMSQSHHNSPLSALLLYREREHTGCPLHKTGAVSALCACGLETTKHTSGIWWVCVDFIKQSYTSPFSSLQWACSWASNNW